MHGLLALASVEVGEIECVRDVPASLLVWPPHRLQLPHPFLGISLIERAVEHRRGRIVSQVHNLRRDAEGRTVVCRALHAAA